MKTKQVTKLLEELSRDPRVEKAIARSTHHPRKSATVPAGSLVAIFVAMLAIAARFSSKKMARAVDELMDTLYFLLQVSIVLKENVFDRPEVKNFFNRRSKQLYSIAQESAALILGKTKAQAITHRSRPAPLSRRHA